MYQGDKFRLITATLGILSNDGHRIPVKIPKNATIEVLTGLLNHERMVEVQWEGHVVMMFAQDVRERCKSIR